MNEKNEQWSATHIGETGFAPSEDVYDITSDNGHVCRVVGKERAAQIVLAVNSHKQLVEALRMIEECLNEGYEDAAADSLHHAREAIRLANGE